MLPPDTGEIRGTAHGAGTASLRLSVGAADSESSTLREQVISQLIARDVANDEAVQRFRTEALVGTLLTSDDGVRAWIIRHARGEPQEQAPQDSEHDNHRNHRNHRNHPVGALAYALHGVKQIERPIGAGGMLDRLRRLSEDLAARFAWTDAQATTFVMTGAVPLIREVKTVIERHAAYPALTRIRLAVSPMATPQEVASSYQQARAQLVMTRPRDPGERQLQLVLFVDAQPDSEAWSDWMRAWNTQVTKAGCPKWRYTLVTNFKRDAQVTRRRLMSPAYRPTTQSE